MYSGYLCHFAYTAQTRMSGMCGQYSVAMHEISEGGSENTTVM